MRAKPLAILAFGVLGIGLVACSSDDKTATPTSASATQTATAAPPTETATAPGTTTPEAGEVSVAATLKEFAITLSPASIAAGQINFSVANDGTVTHEFVVVKSDLDPKALPLDAAGTAVDEDKVDHIGEIEDIGAGTTATGEFTLEAGKYLLICNLPGHYQGGMVAAFTVE